MWYEGRHMEQLSVSDETRHFFEENENKNKSLIGVDDLRLLTPNEEDLDVIMDDTHFPGSQCRLMCHIMISLRKLTTYYTPVAIQCIVPTVADG